MSDYGKAYLFDFKNKFGLTTDTKEGKFLHDYLNGRFNGRMREDYTTHEKYTAPIVNYGVKDHLKFIYGTKEWAIHENDMMRRLDNVEKILECKYKLSDANPYCRLEVFKYSACDLCLDMDDLWNDAIFDDINSNDEYNFAIYEDAAYNWDNNNLYSDYDSEMSVIAKTDEVDFIKDSSSLDSLLKNISNNTEQEVKENSEMIDIINTTSLLPNNPLELSYYFDQDRSIANTISPSVILTEVELACSTAVGIVDF